MQVKEKGKKLKIQIGPAKTKSLSDQIEEKGEQRRNQRFACMN